MISAEKITAPYGSWKSPITADVVSGAEKGLGGTAVDSDGRLYWLESRPTELGRTVLVKEPENPGDEPKDITPKEFSVGSVVNECTGGAFQISGDTLIFSNYEDLRLYKQLITSDDYGGPIVCYADGEFDLRFNRYVTVREDRRESSLNPTTTIVSISLGDNNIHEISTNVSVLLVVILQSSSLQQNPSSLPQGNYFSLRIDKMDFGISINGEVLSLYSLDAEFARPFWSFGMNSYEFMQCQEGKHLIACSYRQNGKSYLGILDNDQRSLSLLDIPFTDINNITSGIHCLYIEGGSSVHPSSVAKVTLDDHRSKVVDFKIVWSSSPDSSKYISHFSLPELIKFPTNISGQNGFAYFYPPSNPSYEAGQKEKPPLLVKCHGGPTLETRGILNLSIQYWTSQGWALVDVNYGGSTGYGREYRERLLRRWGIVDVNDCCSCAKFLVDTGKVDGQRLCIAGDSAGGYTTLAALAFKDVFKTGASLYGIADLPLVRAQSHKFESYYTDNLVVSAEDYFERSPVNFVDKFSCPVILFQGLEDKSVSPEQAQKIYTALKEKGLPVALVEYEGEGHGFGKAENIKFTLEQEMVFFVRLVGRFKVADEITPIKIENFD